MYHIVTPALHSSLLQCRVATACSSSVRMGKTRDLFKNIRDTKGTFHAKMGSTKDRNGMDLTEAEDIKEVARIHRRLYKKIFTIQIITMV